MVKTKKQTKQNKKQPIPRLNLSARTLMARTIMEKVFTVSLLLCNREWMSDSSKNLEIARKTSFLAHRVCVWRKALNISYPKSADLTFSALANIFESIYLNLVILRRRSSGGLHSIKSCADLAWLNLLPGQRKRSISSPS